MVIIFPCGARLQRNIAQPCAIGVPTLNGDDNVSYEYEPQKLWYPQISIRLGAEAHLNKKFYISKTGELSKTGDFSQTGELSKTGELSQTGDMKIVKP